MSSEEINGNIEFSYQYDQGVLSLKYEMPFGENAIDDDENNPLARALRRTIYHGNPDQKIVLCFCREVTNDSSSGMKWFGVFVLTKKGKVVFFPGTKSAVTKVMIKDLYAENHMHDIECDHVTLNSNRDRWHITGVASRHHIRGPRTLELGNERKLWFGFSVSDFSHFREVKRITHIQANVPESDFERRVSSISELDNDVVHQVLELHKDVLVCNMINHFAVIVLPEHAPDYTGRDLGIPTDMQFVKNIPDSQVMVMSSRHHRISLEKHLELQVVTVAIPGVLKIPLLVTGQVESYRLKMSRIRFHAIAKYKRLIKRTMTIIEILKSRW